MGLLTGPAVSALALAAPDTVVLGLDEGYWIITPAAAAAWAAAAAVAAATEATVVPIGLPGMAEAPEDTAPRVPASCACMAAARAVAAAASAAAASDMNVADAA